MRASDCVGCKDFPCEDVNHDCYMVPKIDVNPGKISVMMISEAAPTNLKDYYYATGNPLFQQTTVQAFKDAGIEASTIEDLVNQGIYFTTAVKCGKKNYGIPSSTVKECSRILEKEIALFPKLKVIMLMGDVAISAVNQIAKKTYGEKVIPAGSTYKVRKGKYYFNGRRVFPSYLQAGPSFFIEKSKRRMIAEDIASAMRIAK